MSNHSRRHLWKPLKTPLFNLKMSILVSHHSRRHLWNLMKTPLFNLKMLILVNNHSRRHLWKAVHHNPILNGHPRLVHRLGSVKRRGAKLLSP